MAVLSGIRDGRDVCPPIKSRTQKSLGSPQACPVDVSVSSFGLYRWLAVAGDAAPASHRKSAFLDGFGSAGFAGYWQLDFAEGFWGWQAVTARGSRLFKHDGFAVMVLHAAFGLKLGLSI